MAEQKITIPDKGMPPMMIPQIPDDSNVQKLWIKLLNAQIEAAEDEMELRRQRRTAKDRETKSRKMAAEDARKKIIQDNLKKEMCPHERGDGESAFGGKREWPDPVTRREKFSILCMHCGYVEEGTEAELQAKWGRKFPPRHRISSVSVDVDY